MFKKTIFLFASAFFITSCTAPHIGTPDTLRDATATGHYATGMTEEEKVKLAQERRNELRNIRKGDYMTLKNNPESAVSYYQTALERLPDDIVVKRKLARAYFLMKNWKKAYDTYSQVPISELRDDEYQELFQSLFFDDSRPDRLTELSRYTLDDATRDYYQVVDVCYSGIHNCIVTIEAYSGASSKVRELQDTIKQSTQVTPDYQYRNFLVSALFYKQSMYRAVDVLTREILEKRPNYIEVRKLRGFSLYELGKYPEAKTLLLSYLQEKPKNIETIIRLGEVFYRLGDYATSNLYLNNAVTSGYPKKTELERQLAYNYGAMQDNVNMLKVLSYLLQEDDVSEDDYAVAVSLALKNGENIKAYAWAYAGIEKFKDSKILIPLYLQSLRTNGKSSEAIDYLSGLDSEAQKNPLIQLERAIALYEVGKLDDALSILRSVRNFDASSDWGIEADNYIRVIEAKKSLVHSGSLIPF